MNRRARTLMGLDLFVGATAVAGGVSLITGWINPPLSSLDGSPFSDYTVPGICLALLVGGSGLLAAWLTHRLPGLGVLASAVAGGAITVFEVVEWLAFGFSGLLAVYLAIGVVMIALAGWIEVAERPLHLRSRRRPSTAH